MSLCETKQQKIGGDTDVCASIFGRLSLRQNNALTSYSILIYLIQKDLYWQLLMSVSFNISEASLRR